MSKLYLKEGLVCLESPDGTRELLDLATGRTQALDGAQADAARALARGLEGDAARQAGDLLAPLADDLVAAAEEPFDRVVRQRLTALDATFAWTAAGGTSGLLELCELAHSLLRHSRQDLDQLPVLPETTARRALLLAQHCQPGAEVVLVGDDDLVGVAAAGLGLRPTVLDLDDDLLETYELITSRLGLAVTLRRVDLRQPMPAELLGSFDAFCTDPETSRECICLFMSRGLALVRPGGVGLLACAEEWEHLVDEAAGESQLERLGLYRRFNNYRDWAMQLAFYRSDLHLFRVTDASTPQIAADDLFEENLFPFGLLGADHLVATALRCDPEATRGGRLPRLMERILGTDDGKARVEDRKPFPVRVVTAETEGARAQATVQADGVTVDIDIWPAPADDAATGKVAQALTEGLGARQTRLRALKRLE